MPNRLKAFLRGSADAHPGDYLLAIVAVVTMMLVIASAMLAGQI